MIYDGAEKYGIISSPSVPEILRVPRPTTRISQIDKKNEGRSSFSPSSPSYRRSMYINIPIEVVINRLILNFFFICGPLPPRKAFSRGFFAERGVRRYARAAPHALARGLGVGIYEGGMNRCVTRTAACIVF